MSAGSSDQAPHILRVAPTPMGACQLFMVIKKPAGVQSLPVVSVPVPLSDFCASFNSTKWEQDEDSLVEGEDFFAIRYIRLSHDKGFVVWRVHHPKDAPPDDVLAFFPGKLPDLREFFANHE